MSLEFYKLVRRFPMEAHQTICSDYWQLSLDLESPDESIELIVVDREQGTLIHDDQEYTILEVHIDPPPLFKGVTRGHYLIRTPRKPDKLKRILT